MLNISEYTLYVLSNISIVGVVLFVISKWKYIFSNRISKKNNNYFLFWLAITLFSLFYVPNKTSDFWGYLTYYGAYLSGNYWTLNMEPFYYWLIDVLPKDYLLWRFVVWGSAACFYILCFKALSVKTELAIILFCVFVLVDSFYFLRNSLGFAVLFLGVILLIKTLENKKKNIKYICVGLALIVASLFLHKSMPIYLLIVVIAYFIPYNRSVFFIALLLFPLLYITILDYSEILLFFFDKESMTHRYGLEYLSYKSNFDINIYGVIQVFFMYSPVLYILFISIYRIVSKKDNVSKTEKVLLMSAFLLIYISFLFWAQAGKTFQYRFWRTGLIPLTLFLSKYLDNKRHLSFYKKFVYLMILQYIFIVFIKIATSIVN